MMSDSSPSSDSSGPIVPPGGSSGTGSSSGPQPLAISRKVVGSFLVIVFLLLALLLGGGLYLLSSNKDDSAASTNSQQDKSKDAGTATTKPSAKPLKTGITTQTPTMEIQLDSLTSGTNSVVVRFSAVCVAPTYDGPGGLCFTYNLWEGNDLAGAYFVDDASQQKYEIVTDANGKTLNAAVPKDSFKKGEKLAYYVQLTAPPKGTTVTLYLPDTTPISGLTIK